MSTTTTQPDLAELKFAMAATNEVFNTEVFGKRNFEALASIYTANARILPPGSPMISGLGGIKAFWSDLIISMNASAAVLSSVDVMLTSEGPVEIGKAVLSVAPDNQPTTVEVKYVVYWQQESGTWKWHVDIWN